MQRLLLSLLFALAAITAVTVGFHHSGTAVADTHNRSLSPDALLEQQFKDYILNHPEVIVEAIQKWQAQQQRAQAQQNKAALSARRGELFNDPDAPVGGNPAGDVTVVEFMDYNCPYCRRASPVIIRLIETDPNVRLLFKEFPILGPGSESAARAALASVRQGHYMPFHNAMMQSDQHLEEPQVLAIAERIGLDIERLKQDMADPQLQQLIERNLRLARELGINGTPSFVIGDEIVPGLVDLATLQQLVEKARQSE